MEKIFAKAKDMIKAPEDNSNKEVIMELGIEALEENSKWVALHYSRKATASNH